MPNPADPGDTRLAELLRQRELVARHLAWLDSEILGTQATRSQPQSPPPTPAPVILPVAPPTRLASQAPLAADAILAQAPTGITPREKWGCFAIVAAIIILILGAIFILPYLIPKFR